MAQQPLLTQLAVDAAASLCMLSMCQLPPGASGKQPETAVPSCMAAHALCSWPRWSMLLCRMAAGSAGAAVRSLQAAVPGKLCCAGEAVPLGTPSWQLTPAEHRQLLAACVLPLAQAEAAAATPRLLAQASSAGGAASGGRPLCALSGGTSFALGSRV